MHKEKRTGNITPLGKRTFPVIIEKSSSRTPNSRSFMIKSDNSPLPKITSSQINYILKSQKHPIKLENPINNEDGITQNEKALINEIFTLRKERNETYSSLQRNDATLKNTLENLKNINQSLKNIMKKIIPLINEETSPRTKSNISEILQSKEKIVVEENEVQCNLMIPENDSIETNEVSTGPQTVKESKETTRISVSTYLQLKENESEKEGIKAYAAYSIHSKRNNGKTKKREMSYNIFPDFIKSLCL